MKNSNRQFFRDKWNIFETLSHQQVKELCFSDITFTNLSGFLFLKKTSATDHGSKISGKVLSDSMKESLLLSQN